MTFRLAAIIALAGSAAPAFADVVPPAYAAAPGTAGFLGPLANSQRTYQMLIHANMLTGFVGQDLTGLAFRSLASATTAWPTADVSFSTYDIYLSDSVDPANRSLTFANNVVGTQTQVRSGALNITANTYGFGSSPNPFGPTITFTTPYTYTGGNLLIEIRHQGFTGTSRSVDAIGTSIAGYGTDFSACWTGSYTGTAGTQGNFCIIDLVAGGSPPPSCYANCDESTVDPILNVGDFACFLNAFASGESYANCDGSTTKPVLNVQDFSCFLNAFAAGCS